MASLGPDCDLPNDQLTHVDIDPVEDPANNSVSYLAIAGTDAEICRTEETLSQNTPEQLEELNYHSSPLLRLPADIISEIFKTYIFGKDTEFMDRYSTTSELPGLCSSLSARLLFGSICRAWRGLAWSLPWMWSSISLVLDHPAPDSAGLINEWLSRSGQSALNIKLKCDALDEEARGTVLDIISVVSRFSERWSHIVLDLPAPCYAALRCVEGRVPLIVFVSMGLRGAPDGLPDPLEMFSVAPKLRVVHVDKFPMHPIVLPIAQFHLLIGYQSDVTDTLGVLRTSPQLAWAMFKILEDPHPQMSDPNIHPRPTVIPNLRLLFLTLIPTSSDMNRLLDNLTLPNLHTLRLITNDTVDDVFGHSNFISFISRSACPLQFLSIDTTSMQLNDEDLLHCLEIMPSLAELDIHLEGISSETILNLKVTPDGDPVLPNLQRLTITSETLVLDFIELYDMVYTRREVAYGSGGLGRSLAKLEFVRISTLNANWESYQLGIPSLWELLAEGMQIQLACTQDGYQFGYG